MLTPNNSQNCCNKCCCPNSPNSTQSPMMVGGFIPKEHLEALPMSSEISGSWGPLSWEIEFDITESDPSKDYFKIKLMFFGTTIINDNLSETHPEIDVNLTILGVGLSATIGVDFTNKIVFLRGNLNFVVYSKQFDITLLKF